MSTLFSSSTVFDAIYHLLNAEDEEEKDRLTERWRDSKLEELNFMGIVGGLLAAVLTSTNSWPNVLSDGTTQSWQVRACWFSGLACALACVLTAASQSIRLHRISSLPNGNACIRALLSSRAKGRQGEVLPRRTHVFLWQMSVLYLMCIVFIMVAGMFVLLWSAVGGKDWWDGQVQLAITFTCVVFVIACVFACEQYTLFAWNGAATRPPIAA
ncbi:hypothetical protein LTR37_002471 [Vermiconidia calcicola]|uniref:Uncharacterized protein n=1 Tax=Vermiconidia calcicola TaxID=1690605 RepID=A0ACC3NT59_9PEZI|nr:hypothetical protein LTR37_002471 [Vermiconidia calcicola]